MNETDTVELSIVGMHCERCVERIREALSRLDGIETFDVTLGAARLRYYPMAVSIDRILTCISSLGYTVPQAAPRRGLFTRFIDGMIRANEQAFGSQAPSCCTMKKG